MKSKQEITKTIQEQFGIKNQMAIPQIRKVIVNVGVRNAVADKKNMEIAQEVVMTITGQKPKVTKAKKSISSFKLREGDKIGLVVTLRGKRMNDFFSKLVNVVLPRIKDFRGVKKNAFDNRGNYTLGLSEYSVFPEVDTGKVDRIQGIEITIVTSAKNREEGFALLKEMGMPFQK